MKASADIFWGTLFILAYIVAPIMLFRGWVRWTIQRPRKWTIPSTLSFVGFVSASASALFAICVIIFGANWYEHTPKVIAYCIEIGAALSAFGFVAAICGLWRNSQLRWHAPIAAIATFAFWILAIAWV